ncbi:MAG: radical SAM protein [Acidimicrobiales bacterium]
MTPPPSLRWQLSDDEDRAQGALFEEQVERHIGRGEYRGMEFLHVNARRIINEVPAASRLPFRFTINAYRGCSHACSYCFARPTHEFLGMNSGTDFERRIVVKVNAVERLRSELKPSRWGGHHIAMGTNTDPYQRCEAKFRLTQGIVTELAAAANPFSILTKSTLILRDLDLLSEAANRTDVRANFSIGTLDEEVWRLTEPGTPHPKLRVEALAKLQAAGIPCGVLVAPVLPGLSDRDDQLEAVVDACVAAGATSISPILLHLRPGVREHYLQWLADVRPELVAEHDRLYQRAYAPKRAQQALARRVARMVDRRGGLVKPPREARSVSRPAVPPTPAGRSIRGRQLSLDV